MKKVIAVCQFSSTCILSIGMVQLSTTELFPPPPPTCYSEAEVCPPKIGAVMRPKFVPPLKSDCWIGPPRRSKSIEC